MASVNKWIGIGHLGNDPEMRSLPSGDSVANISIACTEQWKDKNGEKQERTEWVRIAMFGKLAEIAGQYLRKGAMVYIEGRLQTDKYTDKDGVEKYATKIVGSVMKMLSPKSADQSTTREQPKPERGGFDDLEDDIPF